MSVPSIASTRPRKSPSSRARICSTSTPPSASTAAPASPACPVEAIFEEDAVPDKWKEFTQKNYDYYEKK